MRKLISLLTILSYLFSPASSFAQSVDVSWLKQAGISCGGGLGVEVQGEIESALIKRLAIGGIGGEGSYSQSDVETLLSQFRGQQKQPVYQDYLTCLITLMQTATTASGLPPKEVELSSPISVDPLDVVQRGQRFSMAPGDVVAVRDMSLIFTVDKLSSNANGTYLHFTWSNSQTLEGQTRTYVLQASPIKLGESCVIVPYKINTEANSASLLSNC
ncbi:MAG: hypothetical protein ABJI96_00790 [Paracoccaceae bacterium]